MLYHNGFYAMGTRFHIVFPEMEDNNGDRAFRIIKNEVKRIESKLSVFASDSEITRINNYASKNAVNVGPEVFEVLKTCCQFSDITHGAFNVSMRPLLKYWKNQPDAAKDNPSLTELLNKLNMRFIVLNESEKSVSFENKDVEIDLGGYGKGYALERVNKLLNDFSIHQAFISFGESSILTLGSHPAGDHWKIGIKDYYKPDDTVHTFNINDGSVSTSSNFFVDDHGKLKNHRHVINPFNGCPVEELVTVSVCAKSAVTAEVLSTAFLVLHDDEIREIRSEMNDLEIVKINYTSDKP